MKYVNNAIFEMQVNIKYTYPFITSGAKLFWLLEIMYTFCCQEHSNMCMYYHNWASSDACSERNDQHLKQRGKLAAYCLVSLILLLKCIQLTHIWPNDGKDVKQVVNSLYLKNSCEQQLTGNFTTYPLENAVEWAPDQACRCNHSWEPAWSFQVVW